LVLTAGAYRRGFVARALRRDRRKALSAAASGRRRVGAATAAPFPWPDHRQPGGRLRDAAHDDASTHRPFPVGPRPLSRRLRQTPIGSRAACLLAVLPRLGCRHRLPADGGGGRATSLSRSPRCDLKAVARGANHGVHVRRSAGTRRALRHGAPHIKAAAALSTAAARCARRSPAPAPELPARCSSRHGLRGTHQYAPCRDTSAATSEQVK
jgi:hypothetical protein